MHAITVTGTRSRRMVSIDCSTSVFAPYTDDWSSSRRWRMRPSISSKKRMHGARSRATLKAERMSLGVSPKYLSSSVLSVMQKKGTPDSCASARASIVLPVPGGPWKSSVRGGVSSARSKKTFG